MLRRGYEKAKCVMIRCRRGWHDLFLENNRGMGTVEIILIIVVLIGLVLIFKNQITELVENLMDKVSNKANKI